MTTFHGTLELKKALSPSEQQLAKKLGLPSKIKKKYLMMDRDFHFHKWKDGDLLKVRKHGNGTICFYHVEPIVRYIEI
mgnify:CR=1 FL=1